MISSTEELLRQWQNNADTTPYYKQVCKSWEHFLHKQKEELNFRKRMYQTTDTFDG
jgi:hypothetical protein